MKNALSRVTDILQRLGDQVPYSQIKTALLDRYSSEQSESPHSLLYQCERGKDTVVDFLSRLKTRLGRHYDADSCLINDLIRHRLLESVDPQIRLGLYHYESGSVDDLARHADRLLDRFRRDRSEPHFRTDIADNQRQNNDQRLINEMLETQLDSLRREVSNLVSDSPSTPHQPTGRQRERFALHNNRFMFDNRAPGENPTRPQAPVCHYHARFGNRAHNCTDPPCPFSDTSRNVMISRPQNSQLHNKSQLSFDDPLFLKVDKISGATFLIDSGAARSLFPVARVANQQVQPSILTSLRALGDGRVPILGRIEAQIDVGFSRLFGHEFCVCDMEYGILGADFLTCHKLIVDLAAQILTESIEVEQCPRYPEDDMGKEFVIQTDSESDDLILNGLKITFPEMFDPTLRKRHADHSVVASVETTTEEPISCKARRLSPDKFRALQDELKRLCEQGVLERSQSA